MPNAPQWRPPRHASYSLLATAFLVVGLYAAWQTVRLSARQEDEAQDRARAEVAALVQIWARGVRTRSAAWLADLAEARDPAAVERRIRASAPWFDTWYIWGPAAPPGEASGQTDPGNPALAERLARANESARLSLLQGAPARAWDALQRVDLPLYAPISDALVRQIPVRTLVARRAIAAEALDALGDRPRHRVLLTRTASELVRLPGDVLVDALTYAGAPLLLDLTIAGEDALARALTQELARADRVSLARAELAGRQEALTALADERRPAAAPEGAPIGPADLQTAHDLYREHGYVLLFAALPGRDATVAAQLSQDGLLDELVSALPATSGDDALVVRDQDGRGILGSCRTPGALWGEAPVDDLLDHLRIGFCAPSGQASGRRQVERALVQLTPLLLALVLGGVALTSRARADAEQRALVERQRAFTARVTHELKTPLAGIRVMAETLEIGAFRGDAQREEFAGRIVAEVDRLGARIDEVLSVTRSREGARAPVRLDVLAAAAARPWVERFRAVGGALHQDLKPCPELVVDAALLTDAITNLLDNALKYRREDRPLEARIETWVEGRWVVLAVTDNGLGVPSAQRKAIFEPYVRVEGPGRGKSGGHGLGLSFVAETARSLGGTVECREGIDGGARLVLRLRRNRWKKGGWRAFLS